MKLLIATVFISLFIAFAARSEELCDVRICNKLERFTLDPWKMMKDSMGEQCFNIKLPKSQAQTGKVLSEESRWYQGSTWNPTKKSVTRVKEVYGCSKI